jgi:hypothetical protein
MTFAKPEKDSYRGGKVGGDDAPPPPKPCSECRQMTPHDALMTYGARCMTCYDSYCRQTPSYMAEPNKYPNDPRGWAKRIIDKHNEGRPVAKIALEFAREALR